MSSARLFVMGSQPLRATQPCAAQHWAWRPSCSRGSFRLRRWAPRVKGTGILSHHKIGTSFSSCFRILKSVPVMVIYRSQHVPSNSSPFFWSVSLVYLVLLWYPPCHQLHRAPGITERRVAQHRCSGDSSLVRSFGFPQRQTHRAASAVQSVGVELCALLSSFAILPLSWGWLSGGVSKSKSWVTAFFHKCL